MLFLRLIKSESMVALDNDNSRALFILKNGINQLHNQCIGILYLVEVTISIFLPTHWECLRRIPVSKRIERIWTMRQYEMAVHKSWLRISGSNRGHCVVKSSLEMPVL